MRYAIPFGLNVENQGGEGTQKGKVARAARNPYPNPKPNPKPNLKRTPTEPKTEFRSKPRTKLRTES